MKYMVMECHFSYAVVLDEQGRFLNVANRQYEVGQTVTDVIEMRMPQKTSSKKNRKWIYSFAAMAACLIMVVTALLPMDQTPYASVYMTINPEVRIDVDRKDIVVGLEGVNADGQELIRDYRYKKKDLDLVMDELVDLAIETGYLYEGGKVTLTLDAQDSQWVIEHGDRLTIHLNEYLTEKMTITIEVTDKNAPVDSGDSHYAESDYNDTDYGPNNDGVTDYDDTDYGPNNDGVTDYNDTDYGPNNDGVTDYEEPEVDPDDGETDYEEPEVDPDDGATDYEEPEVDPDDGATDYEEPDDGMTDYDSEPSDE